MPDDYEFDTTGHVREQTVRNNPTVDGEEIGENENKEAAREAVRKAIKEASAKEKAKKGSKTEDEDDEKPVKKEPSKSVKKPSAGHKSPPPDNAEDDEVSTDEEGVDDDPGADEDPDEVKKGGHKKSPEVDEEDDTDGENLRKVLKNRAKIAKEKAKAAEENQRIQQEFGRQKAALEQQAWEIEQGRKQLQRLKENPVEAVRAAGWDPEAFIMDLAQSGTPEGQAQAKLRAMEQQIAQQNSQWEALQRQQEQNIARAQYEQAVNYRQSMETQFLAVTTDAKQSPYTAAFYKGREAALLAEGDIIAKQYNELTGKIAYPQQIAEYMEEVLAERAEAWYKETVKSRTSQEDDEEEDDTVEEEAETQASGVKGKRPKVSRTIESSPRDKRSLTSKNLADLDEDELREQARANVRLAISKAKKTKN